MRLTVMRVLLLGLIASGGTGAAAYYGGVIDKPEFGIIDKGDWGTISDDRVDIHTSLWVYNPNPLGVNITDVRATYGIQMNGVSLADGGKEQISIEKGNNTVELTTSLIHRNVPQWWARHLRNDEKSLLQASTQIYVGFLPTAPTINGIGYTDTIDTDIIGMLDESMSSIKGTYTGPGMNVGGVDTRPRIEIRGGSASWGKVTSDTTPLHVTTTIHNPNTYPIPVPGLDGDLTMNGVPVGSWAGDDAQILNAPADRLIPPKGTRDVSFRINIDNNQIDDWFITHIKKGEQTDAETTIRLRFDIGDIRLYVPRTGGLTCSFSFTTAILEDESTSGGEFKGCESGQLTADPSPTGTGNDGTSDDQDDTSNDKEDSSGGLTDGVLG